MILSYILVIVRVMNNFI